MEGHVLAEEAASMAVSQALEVAIPTHMTPLCLNVVGIKRVSNSGLRGAVRDHPPPGLPCALMCTMTIWGQGWHIPCIPKCFLTQMSSGTTRRITFPTLSNLLTYVMPINLIVINTVRFYWFFLPF